jgi:hypothetical protein
MSDWLHELPVPWIAVIVLVAVSALVAAIYLIVMRLAVGERGEAIHAVSPGLLPALAIVFALIVGFLAAGVWGDSDKARDAVSNEASALRSVVLLRRRAAGGDRNPDARSGTRADPGRGAPRMAGDAQAGGQPRGDPGAACRGTAPRPCLQGTGLRPGRRPARAGRVAAAGIRSATAADHRQLLARQRREVDRLLGLATVMLVAIACVHSANRRSALVAMSLYAAAIVVVAVMLVAQDEPFTGHLGQSPDLLEQVIPQT